MKKTFALFATVLYVTGRALGGVPLAWTVDAARGASYRAFDQWAGAEYELEATVTSAGRPLEIDGDVALYYQTNGMGRTYWKQPAAASNNVIRATWLPSYEAGAGVYSGFLGAPGKVWNAAFQLRLRPSPGASPNALALPAPRIDFAAVEVANAPWATEEGVDAKVAAATDGLLRAEGDPHFTAWTNGASVAVGKGAEARHEGATSIGPHAKSHGPHTVNFGVADISHIYVGNDLLHNALVEAGFATQTMVYDRLMYDDLKDIGVSVMENDAGYVTEAITNGLATAESVEAVSAEVAGKADASAVYAKDEADARFFPAAEGESVWSFLTAENFSVVVTNYGSAANGPSLIYRYRISTNDPWRIVWTETNGLRRVVERATNLAARAAAELAAKPENRAWGRYDSQTGEAAPDGVVQVSAAGGLMIGGGVSWSQIEAGGGSYWLLTSTDPTLCATGTNGVLSIVGSDGEEAVRVVKGDRLTVPAPASGIAKTPGHVSVTYSIVSDAHPTAEFGRSPVGPWLRDGDEGSPVSFSWSGGSGAWQLDFDVSGGDDVAGYVRATYETGGDSYTAFGGGGVELGRIRVGGIPYTAGVSQVDGKTVLTLTPTDR